MDAFLNQNQHQVSLDYVAEYKSTTPSTQALPFHLYQAVNQCYLHMRRTAIDQSILLSGDTGSGKSETCHRILSHLISLSVHKKESKLQTQILHVQSILNAFGHAKTSTNQNASRFGKYMEIQFNERGRMIGCKVLNYLLDKQRVVLGQQKRHGYNFHIFYMLLCGAPAQDKTALSLTDYTAYRYTKATSPPFTNDQISEDYQALLASLKHIGLGKRHQTRIMQLIASLLHLGQLQFVDDTTMQEAAYVKNVDTLELVSDFLGIDPRALENVLTYKTQLIKKDITTLILNADQAAAQRDELVTVLYSLLFTWLIEQINSKLCSDEIHNFIGILDLPGAQHISTQSTPSGLDQLCLNYSNERLHSYITKYIFESSGAEYSADGLDYRPVESPLNASCIDLFDQPRHGIIDIVNSFSKKATTTTTAGGRTNDQAMLDTMTKYQTGNESYSVRKSETGAPLFAIQHFGSGGTQVLYQPEGFIEANRDALNADFVSLFKGGSDLPPSTNSLLIQLFQDKSITTESHPKDADAIMNAQQVNKPNRMPSMRRSKSTKRSSTLEQQDVSKAKKAVVPAVLSQLRSSLDDLFATLDETMPWFVYCICPNQKSALGSTAASSNFDSQLVQTQVKALGLEAVEQRVQSGYFNNVFQHQEFCERYADILDAIGVDQDRLPRAKCQAAVDIFGWATSTTSAGSEIAVIGNSKIFLNDAAWRDLEDKLRAAEKQDQKKQKELTRESRATMLNTTKQEEMMSRNMSQDEYSHASSGSNADLLTSTGQSDASAGQHNDRRAMAAAHAAAMGLPAPRGFADQGNHARMSSYSGYSEDQHAHHHHRQPYASNDTDSQTVSDNYDSASASGYLEMKTMPITTVDDTTYQEEEHKVTAVRKRWLLFVWAMTWWVPTPFMVWCGRMKRKDIQIAWREKFALCIIIFFMSGFIIWFLVFFGKLICPHQDVFSQSELQAHSSGGDAYVAIRGEVFDLTRFAPHHWASQVIPSGAITQYGGKDASDLFPVQVSALCEGVNGTVSDYVSLDYHFNLTDANSNYHDFRAWTDDPRPDWYFEKLVYLRKNYKVGTMGYTNKDVYRQANNPVDMGGIQSTRVWGILNESIYDLTYYVSGGRHVQVPVGMETPTDVDTNYMSDVVVNLFRQKSGEDITAYWNALPLDPEVRRRQEVCLKNLFFVGSLDQRNSPQCIFSEYLLLIVTVFLCLVIVFKFLAALQFSTKRDPQNHDKFVICQVPCYTEGEEELKKTIDSIAALKYDDKRKLLFIICDGMIVGGGNDRPTPRIVLDILGVDPYVDPEALSFLSVGEGQKQHNMAKVYSGLYECQGHVVPYIVVSKVGKLSERQKPGNRGKRDSQLILMRFLNKVHFNAPMTPMELEVYHQIKNIIGVNPSFYEFVLMVDADTEVEPDGLNRLVSSFVHDAKIIGLCGETKLSNEKDTWVTMIQVYEYFISHYMIKAFESLFGSVTCLPGCFCMYRVRSPTKNQPLLVSNQVIEDYQINRVDTLHKKNLLHLGEDRYLTTLILKHFPTYKTKFVPDAKCATNAPDQWSVLLSQRRRWINSTIHNLGELVFLPQLCGFCCFSMRFVVMLDLISTLVQPAIVGYLVFLIYTLATSSSNVPIMSIITIAGVYGLQAIIFILHKKWEHIIWMIVSIFAIPVFSLYIPIYAYWHFDDFSWGNTRVVLGDKGKKLVVGADEGKFDPNSIPTMSWDEYEEGLYTEDYQQNDAASSKQHLSQQAPPQQPPPVNYPSSQYSYNMNSSQSYSTLPIQPNPHASFIYSNPNPHYSMMSGLNHPQQQQFAYNNNNPSSPLHRYE
ncbi:chitin synthase [Mucor lusitanicus CBS 277.49]|uniref:chitin synthase n=1 Tax=Mucor lusitanicus CBS 277.49 TaxID=747725 RepID=A0A168GXM0_MUCCL|nr:chitin synthase [Mucor lusitanicus CBS 277.49]